ncbi:MAG: glycosyltransferase family 2 protein [Syntrophales bacterium]
MTATPECAEMVTNTAVPAGGPNGLVGTCAIIVTFHPDPSGLRVLLAALQPQVQGIVVVDNGSVGDLAALLSGTIAHLLPLGENLGVAAGFNRGIRQAETQGFSRFLLLDQDSVPAPDMVARLNVALDRLSVQGEHVAAVGARICDPATGHSFGFARFGLFGFRFVARTRGSVIECADFLVSSGSLIPLATIQRVGLMDERLFIDLVDTEWFLRAAAQGYCAFGVGDAVLQHCLGDRSIRVPTEGGFVPVHTPLRHYYFFRNSMLLNRRASIPLHWKYNNAVQLIFMLVFFTLVTPPRLQHFRKMLRGLWDGLCGRSGRAVIIGTGG